MKEQALDYIFDCVRKAHEAKDYEEFRRAADAYLGLAGVNPNPVNRPDMHTTITAPLHDGNDI